MAREIRMQLYNHEDTSFEFIKRELEIGCLVERKNNEIMRGWKDFYGTLFTFPGHGKMKPSYVSLGYSRDIILDPFNQVPTGEMIDEKPVGNSVKIKEWIAKIGANQFHLMYSKSKAATLYDKAIIALICIDILEALVVGAGYIMKHSHTTTTPPAAALLTLSLMGMVMGKKTPGKKDNKNNFESNNPRNWKRLFYLISGIASAVGCVGLFVIYWLNPLMTILAVPAVALGGASFFAIRAWMNADKYVPVIISKHIDDPHFPNSLTIYPHELRFEYVDEPMGQPHLCRNDHRNYFMHKVKTDKDGKIIYREIPVSVDGSGAMVVQQTYQIPELESFTLPDAHYSDPNYFGKKILELPANRRWLKRKVKMGQIVSMAILFGVMIIEFIAMIAMG